MKEKNTKNAVVPTKDTLQYKHTPKTSKRLISRIFAFLACLLLLLIFTIPTFAYNFGVSVPDVLYASPYAPSALSYSIGLSSREYNVLLGLDFVNSVGAGYTTNPASSVLTYNPIGWNCNFSLYRIVDQSDDVFEGELICRPNDVSLGTAFLDVTAFYWNNITYDNQWLSYVPDIILNYDRDTYVKYLYSISYTDIGGDGTLTQRSDTILIDNLDSSHTAPNLRSIISRATGDPGASIYISELVLTCIPVYDYEGVDDNVDVTFTDTHISCRYYTSNTLIGDFWYKPPTHEIVYQQVVNSGSASSFVEFLTDTVGGFLGTTLFEFGYVNITPGAILSVFGAIGIILWLLKLFLGG